jgi:hypothetical protein
MLSEMKMRALLASWAMVGLVLLGGCGKAEDGARFRGRVVSHVDACGSGTGGQMNLDVGAM